MHKCALESQRRARWWWWCGCTRPPGAPAEKEEDGEDPRACHGEVPMARPSSRSAASSRGRSGQSGLDRIDLYLSVVAPGLRRALPACRGVATRASGVAHSPRAHKEGCLFGAHRRLPRAEAAGGRGRRRQRPRRSGVVTNVLQAGHGSELPGGPRLRRRA